MKKYIEYMSSGEVARQLGVSIPTVRRLAEREDEEYRLEPNHITPSGRWKYLKEEVLCYTPRYHKKSKITKSKP